ncbi:NUDIX hydrolase [Microbacterium sp. 13-71-7]|uniref:NUDIX hydrolase n=1 Tax=Microbacterium sp. 13-71-7 TaxID=1970399 RepID=UPI0025CFFE20|nr:NUDIX hydrolase [Microbacterium sp. 13-71-7]
MGEQGDPSWLPAGSRVQWVTGAVPPSPMGLVRLLIRDDDRVFCVPRERNGMLDLPTREVSEADPIGLKAILALSIDVTGSAEPPRWVGAVRNVVPDPSQDYGWPVPIAHFGVWQVENVPRIDGQWLDVKGETSSLKERHWFPLIAVADLP